MKALAYLENTGNSVGYYSDASSSNFAAVGGGQDFFSTNELKTTSLNGGYGTSSSASGAGGEGDLEGFLSNNKKSVSSNGLDGTSSGVSNDNVQAAARTDKVYSFYYWYGNGDYYYGYTYDDGTYGYYKGYEKTTYNETGNYGYYYIYDAYDLGYDSSNLTGKVYDYYYYDSQNKTAYKPYYYSLGYASGSNGLGSDYDVISGAGSTINNSFGGGYYDAQVTDKIDYFYYWYGNGDYYYGYTYDDGTYGYYKGYQKTTYNETGNYGYYYIYATSDLGYDSSNLTGKVYDYYYYDSQNKTAYKPYYYSLGYASGSNGLGSDYDVISGAGSTINNSFGGGYYDAQVTDKIDYFYYWYGNGDYYYGYTYDDGTYGYYKGYQKTTYNETGNYGYYYIYATSDLGYDSSNLTGKVYDYYYYNSQNNTVYTPYYYSLGYASGSNGLGSDYDVISGNLFGGGYYDAGVGDWFDNHIQDQGIRNTVRSDFAADGSLTRNDMISIFRESENGGVIDSTELTDLRTLVNNYSYLGMANYVYDLSYKIAYSDPANQYYQGGYLGNLYAGSSSTQMEDLIDKWFYGTDHPNSGGYTYQYVSGSLFQNGISYTDINQGQVGDCYYLASLAETAFRSSSTIGEMFIDNGDGTYTVRFYNNGVADYVTVDRYLPTYGGYAVYAGWGGGYYNNSSNELWVALAEKAYAQVNESGWIGQDNTNSYAGIAAGWGYYAIPQITGRSASIDSLDSGDFSSLVSAFNSGRLITIDSKTSGVATSVASNHAYALINYNAPTGEFTLYNPWGVNGGYDDGYFKPGTLELTFSQLVSSFSDWNYSTS